MPVTSILLPLWVIAIVIPAVLVPAAVLGWKTGRATYLGRNYDMAPPSSYPGEATSGALLALLGLLLAFTFGFSLTRAEARKVAQLDEAAAIGTAFLRADVLEEPGRSQLRDALRVYANTRVVDADISTQQGIEDFLARTLEAQVELWPTMTNALQNDTPPAIAALIINGITDVLDAHTVRAVAATDNVPMVAKVMMLACAAAAMFFVGNNAALHGRDLTWRNFVFAGVLAFVMFVIVDFERSQSGFVQLDTSVMEIAVAEIEAAMVQKNGSDEK